MEIVVTEEQLNEAYYQAIENDGKFPGMTYAEGVKATLEWIRGDREDHPMED